MDLYIESASKKYGIDPALLEAVFTQESRYNPRAKSNKGAVGVGQLMPGTASEMGVTDRTDVHQNIHGSAKYLKQQLKTFKGDIPKALAAYNAGPGAVKRYGGVPPYRETQNYVKRIMDMLNPIGTAQAGESEAPVDLYQALGVDPGMDRQQAAMPPDQQDAEAPVDLYQALGVDPGQQQVQYEGRNISDMSGVSKFLTGAGMGPIDLYHGFKQIYDIGDQGQLDKDIAQSKTVSDELMKSKAGAAGLITGNIVPGAVASGGATLPGSVAAAVGYGALQPVGPEDENGARAKNMAISAVAPTVLGGVSKAIKGFTPSAAAKEFMGQGVQPTVGQGIEQGMVGQALRQLEESSTSTPFLGAITKEARKRAAKQWQNMIFKKVEIPGLVSSKGEIGYKGIENVTKGFNKGYSTYLAGHTIPLNSELFTNIDDVIDQPNRFLNDEARNQVKSFVKSLFQSTDVLPGGKISAVDMHKVESELSRQARAFTGSLEEATRNKAQALDDVEELISTYRMDKLPPDVADKIKVLDSKYAVFKRIQKAAAMVGARDGEITPAQLKNAALGMEKSVGNRSRGRALLQMDATKAQDVLGDTLGESGTAPRTFVGNLAGVGGGEALSAYFLGLPKTIAALGLAKIGSTEVGQKALLGGYKVQPTLSEMANRYAKASAMPGAYIGTRREE